MDSSKVMIFRLINGMVIVARESVGVGGVVQWDYPAALNADYSQSPPKLSFGLLIDFKEEMSVNPNTGFLETQVMWSYEADHRVAEMYTGFEKHVRQARSGIVMPSGLKV